MITDSTPKQTKGQPTFKKKKLGPPTFLERVLGTRPWTYCEHCLCRVVDATRAVIIDDDLYCCKDHYTARVNNSHVIDDPKSIRVSR